MDSAIQSFITYLAGAAVAGLTVWVWLLWREHQALAMRVAEFYSKKTDLDDIKRDLRDIRHLVHRLCDKLEVPVFSEPY